LVYGEKRYSFFIPASRAFFSLVEKHVFSLLSNQPGPIDHILMSFGSLLNSIRDRYQFARQQINIDDLHRRCVDVLGGEYEYVNQNEWIVTKDNRRIPLGHASSGQKELAPLLLALQELLLYDFNSLIVIEEPETHLFPESQRDVVEIIATVYNLLKHKSGFFITTHSPYILTSFNNLIQAESAYHDVMEKFNKGAIEEKRKNMRIKELNRALNPNKRIPFDDVSVYEVKDGKCKDIKDMENQLISADVIDGVSDSIAAVFGQLVDISYGDR
jgi:hypothetical protein